MLCTNKYLNFLLSCVILNLTLDVSANNLEDHFICSRSSPEFNDCVKDMFNELQPQVAAGFPELGVPPSDPLYVPHFKMDNIEGLKFKQELTDIVITGMKDAKATQVDFSKLPKGYEMIYVIPEIRVSYNYTMDGVILGIALKGKGHASFNSTQIRSKMRIDSDLKKVDGKDYLEVKNMKYSVETPKAVRIKITNTLSKDKKLTEAMNKFFNDNWRSMFQIFKDVPSGMVEDLMRDSLNKVFSKYPYETIFPK